MPVGVPLDSRPISLQTSGHVTRSKGIISRIELHSNDVVSPHCMRSVHRYRLLLHRVVCVSVYVLIMTVSPAKRLIQSRFEMLFGEQTHVPPKNHVLAYGTYWRRRRLNVALLLFVLILCYMIFLVKDACLFVLYLIYFCLVVWSSLDILNMLL